MEIGTDYAGHDALNTTPAAIKTKKIVKKQAQRKDQWANFATYAFDRLEELKKKGEYL